MSAQSKLLAAAQEKVFSLEIKLKEEAPKVARLHDYEKRIEQLTTMQRLWWGSDSNSIYLSLAKCVFRRDDIKLFNEQSHQLALMVSNDQKMKLQVESYERAQQALDTTARYDTFSL